MATTQEQLSLTINEILRVDKAKADNCAQVVFERLKIAGWIKMPSNEDLYDFLIDMIAKSKGEVPLDRMHELLMDYLQEDR